MKNYVKKFKKKMKIIKSFGSSKKKRKKKN